MGGRHEPEAGADSAAARLDYCAGCGGRVTDFDPDGFEAPDGQRGHRRHVPFTGPYAPAPIRMRTDPYPRNPRPTWDTET
jgi:hypothetical protein